MNHWSTEDSLPGLGLLGFLLPFRLVHVAWFGGGGGAPAATKAAPVPPPPAPAAATTAARSLISQQLPRRGSASTILTGPAAYSPSGALQTQGTSILGIPLHE